MLLENWNAIIWGGSGAAVFLAGRDCPLFCRPHRAADRICHREITPEEMKAWR